MDSLGKVVFPVNGEGKDLSAQSIDKRSDVLLFSRADMEFVEGIPGEDNSDPFCAECWVAEGENFSCPVFRQFFSVIAEVLEVWREGCAQRFFESGEVEVCVGRYYPREKPVSVILSEEHECHGWDFPCGDLLQ